MEGDESRGRASECAASVPPRIATVAQRAERRPRNAEVAGSTPACGSCEKQKMDGAVVTGLGVPRPVVPGYGVFALCSGKDFVDRRERSSTAERRPHKPKGVGSSPTVSYQG